MSNVTHLEEVRQALRSGDSALLGWVLKPHPVDSREGRRDRAKKYRERAEELRTTAEEMTSVEVQIMLSSLADSYERISQTLDGS